MTLIQVFYLFLGLSLLVVLHELGHFIPAKLFKTRVRKFYMFFDFLFPFSKILPFSIFKKKIGDTEYGIGWFPFGGYVDIAGMVDETTSAEELEKDDTPKENQFRFKPAWQRLIIMVGGVTVNMILAMFIYAGLFWNYGEEYLPVKNMTKGIMVIDSIAYKLGLQNGDKLVALDGKPIEYYETFQKDLLLNQAQVLQIEREGVKKDLPISREFLGSLIQKKKELIVAPQIPFVIDTVLSGKPASKSGLQKGDEIVSINNVPTPLYGDAVQQIKSNAGKNIAVNIKRNNQMDSISIAVGSDGKIGIGPDFDYSKLYQTETINYNFVAAVAKGILEPFIKLSDYWKSMMLFSLPKVKVKDNLGGFYSMGKIYPDTWNWKAFWSITALISVILAFMNILPIPMLDGGYIVFLIYEMIVGKPLPEKVQNVLQNVGLFIILGLMIVANGMDVIRGIFG
ncbi:MAG: RIP metalloprotease RseP [Chitinophagales bacterium]|nr:RIP metalloprotease RseP [Bacteroidota bacterium]